MKSINEYLINKNTKQQSGSVDKNDPVLVIKEYGGEYRICVDTIKEVRQMGKLILLHRFDMVMNKCNQDFLYNETIQPDFFGIQTKTEDRIFVFLKEKALKFIKRSESIGYYIYNNRDVQDTVSNKSFKRSIEDIKTVLNK